MVHKNIHQISWIQNIAAYKHWFIDLFLLKLNIFNFLCIKYTHLCSHLCVLWFLCFFSRSFYVLVSIGLILGFVDKIVFYHFALFAI